MREKFYKCGLNKITVLCRYLYCTLQHGLGRLGLRVEAPPPVVVIVEEVTAKEAGGPGGRGEDQRDQEVVVQCHSVRMFSVRKL